MEIERKFLVKNLPADLSQYRVSRMEQGYISVSPVIRIRRSNDEFFLTVKRGAGLVKQEFEVPIADFEYAALAKKTEGNAVKKERYYIPLAALTYGEELTAELDIYHLELNGLVTVEVEFSTEQVARAFTPPDWFGEEKTWDGAYSNASLALYGLPE